MRISLEWLNDYVDISGLAPQAIADALTNSGLEVESIETIGPRFTGVCVARVMAVEPHPNADKLRLVTVDLGASQTQVVCGAPNVREGIRIAFAQEGATVLNRKDGSVFTLGRAKIRGVESAGMVCSIDELGLEESYTKTEDGIWPIDALTNDSQLGQDLKTVLGLQGDTILEVAPTANRGDLMSVMGVAREVAALFERPFRQPQVSHLPSGRTGKPELEIPLTDASVCRYYAGVMMHNLTIGPAPDWMTRRLQAAGVRSISNVVDITNYVMLETGQPLHAFDLDKLGTRGKIDVRRANEGESLTTLDNTARALTTESVIVTMNQTPVALAGVMGGLDTEIGEASTSLLLESAYFPPAAVRKSAKSVGLRSEASARFERGVDVENCRRALIRAMELLQQHAGAEFAYLVESPAPDVERLSVTLRYERIEKLLGLAIAPDTVNTILQKLGFRLQPLKAPGAVQVEVPSFRQQDVSREIDVIEEVIRIYGYDKVPYTLPQKTGMHVQSLRGRVLRKLGEVMRAQGLQEVMTTSLIGQSLLDKTGFSLHAEQTVTVLNSHSSDHTMMRQSLLPNILEVAKFNQAQNQDDVWIYELGRTYFKLGKANYKNSGVLERLMLAGLVTGSAALGSWHQKESVDFYLVKGMLENLFAAMGLADSLRFNPASSREYLHPGKAATIHLGQSTKEIGLLGELHPETQSTLKFRQPVYLFELNVEQLYKAIKQQNVEPHFEELSPYPAIRRDMAFLAPCSVSSQQVIDTLHASKEPLLRQVSLFDEYRSEQLGADNRSLAYRLTFRSDAGTLTDTDADQALTRLKEALTAQLPVQFR